MVEIFSLVGMKLIAAYENSIIIKPVLENSVYQIDINGTIRQQELLTSSCDSMYAVNDILYCIDSKECNVTAYSISKGFTKVIMDNNFYTSDFILKKPYLDEIWHVKENEESTILSSRTDYGVTVDAYFAIFLEGIKQPVFYQLAKDSDYYYRYDPPEFMYFDGINGQIIKYDFKNYKYFHFDPDPAHDYIGDENISVESEKIVAIAQDAIKKIGHSPVLSEHRKDTLLVIDEENKKLIEKIETKRYERLVYADSLKAITYYEGELYTYDVENWMVTKRTDGSFIKKNEEYFFETCHDKLFVYENDKLIEVLDLDELLQN